MANLRISRYLDMTWMGSRGGKVREACKSLVWGKKKLIWLEWWCIFLIPEPQFSANLGCLVTCCQQSKTIKFFKKYFNLKTCKNDLIGKKCDFISWAKISQKCEGIGYPGKEIIKVGDARLVKIWRS